MLWLQRVQFASSALSENNNSTIGVLGNSGQATHTSISFPRVVVLQKSEPLSIITDTQIIIFLQRNIVFITTVTFNTTYILYLIPFPLHSIPFTFLTTIQSCLVVSLMKPDFFSLFHCFLKLSSLSLCCISLPDLGDFFFLLWNMFLTACYCYSL